MPLLKATENEHSKFYKKEELEENSIYSFKLITSNEQKNSIGVSESKFLKDETIPFQIKPWGYEEMKNSDKKVNEGAFCIEKKAAFRGEWGLLTICK